MSEEQKPDGWVLWHPNSEKAQAIKSLNDSCEFCELIHESFEGALEDLKNELLEDYDEYRKDLQYRGLEYGDSQGTLDFVPWIKREGYRIRPVKRVFLDEEPTK